MTLNELKGILDDSNVGDDEEFDFWLGNDDDGSVIEISDVQRMVDGSIYVNFDKPKS